jgi:hypothetical protein
LQVFCPRCRDEYRPGFTHCAECGAELVDHLPDVEETGPEAESVDLVEIYRSNRVDADMMRSVLQGSGIRAVLASVGQSAAYPLTVGALGEGRVFVATDDVERARDVIRAARAGEMGLSGPH